MANHVSHAALPFPVKNARYSVLIPYLDADGDPTDPTTPDTEISKDDAAPADCAEEVGTLRNSVGLLTLTGAETDCSAFSLAAKAASGPKTTLGTFYPRVLAILESGTAQAGGASSITLAAGALAVDLAGCIVRSTGGTGGGGSGGASNQARPITAYNTSTKVATIAPNWETNPSSDTTYDVLLPPGVTSAMLKTLVPATAGRTVVVDANGLVDANAVKVGPSGSGTAQTARDIGASVLISSGTGAGQLSVTSGIIKADLTQILGTTLTETAGQIAAAFKKFFNIATPASTMDRLVLVDVATTVTQVEGLDATDQIAAAVTAALNAYDPPTNAEMVARTLAAASYATAASQAAIQGQTDKLTFDGANNVAANTKKLNDATVQGDGTSLNLWRG